MKDWDKMLLVPIILIFWTIGWVFGIIFSALKHGWSDGKNL